jgi:hypothetical protein
LEKQLPEAQRNNPALPHFTMTLRSGLLAAEARPRWRDETLDSLARLDRATPGTMDETQSTDEVDDRPEMTRQTI